jgi:hypothetical protein
VQETVESTPKEAKVKKPKVVQVYQPKKVFVEPAFEEQK